MKIIDDCEGCEQKELCPVYMGQSCLLVRQHREEIMNEEKQELLKDYTKDVRQYMHTFKVVMICLSIVIALLIAGMVILEVNHQNRMMDVANHASDKMVEMLSQYEWQVEYEIETTGNEYLSGNVFVEK